MTKQEVLDLGFEELPFPSIMNPAIINIGRNRIISIGNIGTPNETVWICEINATNSEAIDDLVCIFNYDYDGYITEEILKDLYFGLTRKQLKT